MSSQSRVLTMLQTFYPQYHPIIAIADIAHSQQADLRLKFECHKVIAKYVEPELKSLEVKGTMDDTRRVSVTLFGESDENVVDVEVITRDHSVVLAR